MTISIFAENSGVKVECSTSNMHGFKGFAFVSFMLPVAVVNTCVLLVSAWGLKTLTSR